MAVLGNIPYCLGGVLFEDDDCGVTLLVPFSICEVGVLVMYSMFCHVLFNMLVTFMCTSGSVNKSPVITNPEQEF